MYLIQPPPGIRLDAPYSYVQEGIISAAGQKTTFNVTIDNDEGVWVRRPHIAVFYMAGGNLARLVPEASAQDRLLVSIRRGNGIVLSDNPIDLLAWNEIAEDFFYSGWTLPPATILTIDVSHQSVGAPNFGMPIRVSLSLSGYRIARSA